MPGIKGSRSGRPDLVHTEELSQEVHTIKKKEGKVFHPNSRSTVTYKSFKIQQLSLLSRELGLMVWCRISHSKLTNDQSVL